MINPVSSNTNTTTIASSAGSKSNSDFLNALQKAVNSYDNTSTPLSSIFKNASEEYGVPLNLLEAVAKAESNFNANAVSSCGAQGIMQLMPCTASSLGVTDSFDAEQNIMGGAKMLSYLLEKYNGNTELALAAYNAGSGNVDKYGGIPPFSETQNYVKKVMEYAGDPITVPDSSSNSSLSGLYQSSGGTSSSTLQMLQMMAEQMKANALSAAYNMNSNDSSGFGGGLDSLSSLLGGTGSINALNGTNTSVSSLYSSLLNLYGGTNTTTAAAIQAMLAESGAASDTEDTANNELL